MAMDLTFFAIYLGGPAVLLVVLGIALILPNRGFPRFHDAYAAPRFITAGVYKSRLSPRDRVLVLPFIRGGRAMRWQAQSHLDFALVEGYGNHLPASFTRWPIVASMQDNRLRPDSELQLRRFVQAKGVTVILVDRRRPGPWPALLARMRLVPSGLRKFLCAKSRPKSMIPITTPLPPSARLPLGS